MKFISNWFKEYGNLHHSHLLIGDFDLLVPDLELFFEKELPFSVKANPDYWKSKFSMFGIEEGKLISSLQSKKSFNVRKIFVIGVESFSSEAQNALLKMFEEPTENTHFFIIVPSAEILLPTLRSRMLLVPLSGYSDKGNNFLKMGEAFFKAGPKQRGVMVENIIEDKDKIKAISLLDSIEAYGRDIFLKRPQMKFIGNALSDIVHLKRHLRGRSPSVKIILEHIGNIIPRI